MKYALIIGNTKYSDSKLVQLKTPDADSQALGEVLKDSRTGNFDEVTLLNNQSESKIRRAISEFLSNKRGDDLVLLYFSGHGVLDDRGGLFLAFEDTQIRTLNATAIPSSFISYEMDHCRSRRQVLILDCCNSGAFARGTKGVQKAITEATFEANEGSGRFVLTASDSTQYAFEGDQIIHQTNLSLFTHFLLEGLQTGKADENNDGFVSLDEWYGYCHTKITAETAQQTPHMWSYRQQGNLVIAKNPFVKEKSAGTEFVRKELTALLHSRETEFHYEIEKLKQLRSEYNVNLVDHWGQIYENLYESLVEKFNESIAMMKETWSRHELDRLESILVLLSGVMGGRDKLIQNLGEVTVGKSNIHSQAKAFRHGISLNAKGIFSAWMIVHEFAHAWDANYGWGLSRALERSTGGFTSKFWSLVKKYLGQWDAGPNGSEDKPGRRGRRPGCNAAGYFYGDKPSGSNWGFDRREDFAEAVAMYIGWQGNNELSQRAHYKIERFLLKNGEVDNTSNVVDNWADYSKYFYPEDGDYKTTKRYKFIDDLIHEKIKVT